eukprot:856114-Heterocapsa_arctica.AAC.1
MTVSAVPLGGLTVQLAVRATRRVTTMMDMMKTLISFFVRTEKKTRGGTAPVTALIPTGVGFTAPVTALRASSVTKRRMRSRS